jgi:hypothetical protein
VMVLFNSSIRKWVIVRKLYIVGMLPNLHSCSLLSPVKTSVAALMFCYLSGGFDLIGLAVKFLNKSVGKLTLPVHNIRKSFSK